MTLPRIYPITDCRISGKSHAEQVRLLIEGGAKIIQLREKKTSSKQFYLDAKQAISIAKACGVKIIINDRADIAYLLEADGLHLGQQDLMPRHARQLLGKKALIGYSTHSVEQAIEAVRMPIDYISVGPIFQTKTKENPDPAVGIEGLKEIRSIVGDFPIVAIGGITLQNARQVLNAGADSVAVISDILSSENIPKRVEAFLSV
ncbi:MAG: thiamine phosphate synthase [Pyrinomonadaceae bacterium]|nr:thiamine phosphate synthase [Pyrinomonadaceae bacterium]MCX7640132.1 thiamine phosphate synthase [Pyrinomonadaceae bacterium]MDW8303280.1 thiamine phosphate synthase [Acidobacteriota bacterium]